MRRPAWLGTIAEPRLSAITGAGSAERPSTASGSWTRTGVSSGVVCLRSWMPSTREGLERTSHRATYSTSMRGTRTRPSWPTLLLQMQSSRRPSTASSDATLQYIFDVEAAVDHAHRALRSGGTVLCAVPVTSRIRRAQIDREYWRFTAGTCRRLFARKFDEGAVDVRGSGNCSHAWRSSWAWPPKSFPLGPASWSPPAQPGWHSPAVGSRFSDSLAPCD
jgi:hypothetical protein